MDFLTKGMEAVNKVVWGVPMLILLIGCGLYLTIRTRGLAFRRFGFIMKNTLLKIFDRNQGEKGAGVVTPFQALATALAATVGTGNIVGVSGAILLGGPGAVFWMWVAALFGMSTKMAEATLAVAYREESSFGEIRGGPMYYLSKGLKLPWLAKVFAFLGTFATFGAGNMVQSNAISNALKESFNINVWISGILVAFIVCLVIVGGIRRIGLVSAKLVPIMSLFYILGAIIVLFYQRANVGTAFLSIFKEAFNTKAALGGAGGYTILAAMRNGVARGVFTNEAGLGTAPIAHAVAITDHPSRQGIWGVFEVFVDTIVVCSLTALVILSTGIWQGHENAATLVATSFSESFAFGKYIVNFGLVLFALSTILGWEYYGETCARYLFGDAFAILYRFIFIPIIVVGAVTKIDLVWLISDNLNALMAVPNLIGIFGLASVVVKLHQDFFKDPNRIREDSTEWKSLLK